MSDWIDHDVPAVTAWARERFPQLPLLAIGHSVGGHAIALSPSSDGLRAAVMVASHAGASHTIKGWAERQRVRFIMRVLAPVLVALKGIEGSPDSWEGISSAQVGLLFLLTSKDEASVGEIAEALRVAPAAVTNLSKRMQGAGLIERVADAADGRLTRLRLTAAGKAASTQSSVVLQSLNGQLTAGFSQQELAVVARWLDHAAKLSGDEPPGV